MIISQYPFKKIVILVGLGLFAVSWITVIIEWVFNTNKFGFSFWLVPLIMIGGISIIIIGIAYALYMRRSK